MPLVATRGEEGPRMMGKPTATVIRVTHRLIDGVNVYTSDDVYGLYIADRDPERAYEAVAPSLQRLMHLNEGLNYQVEPALTYSEMLRQQRHPEQPAVRESTSRSFLVRAA